MDQVYHKFPFSPHPHPLGQGSWGSCKTPASWRKFWAVFAISSSCTWPCHCWKVTSMRPRPRETTRKKTSQPGWVPQVGNAFNGGTMGNNYAELVCWFRFFSALPDVVPQSLLVDVLRTCLTIFPRNRWGKTPLVPWVTYQSLSSFFLQNPFLRQSPVAWRPSTSAKTCGTSCAHGRIAASYISAWIRRRIRRRCAALGRPARNLAAKIPWLT